MQKIKQNIILKLIKIHTILIRSKIKKSTSEAYKARRS